MSSFLGHSFAGLTVYLTTTQWQLKNRSVAFVGVGEASRREASPLENRPLLNLADLPWMLWLISIACIPDIDYLLTGSILQQNGVKIRTTHSLLGVSILPIFTILILWLSGYRDRRLKFRSLQVILAGLSHLILDVFVGVLPLPLLYPSPTMFRLPFGLLPSAGKIQLANSLFYRNLGIELGAIVPLSIALLLSIRNFSKYWQSIAVCSLISVYFMRWAFTLGR
jgi:inner membrane protein